jgi:hypothetical protein
MPSDLPGPHHCIGTARTLMDVVFRTLRARCAARGGSLSLEELDKYCAQISESFSSGFGLFELRQRNCMGASMGIAEMPFAREKILATLLRACGEQSARTVFSLQIERFGAPWICELFESLAEFVHEHVHGDIDTRLIKGYVETAAIPKIKLTIEELLKQEAIKNALCDCVTAFETPGAADSTVWELTGLANQSLAKRNFKDSNACTVTKDEMRRFLILLPQQLRVTLNVKQAGAPVVEPATLLAR